MHLKNRENKDPQGVTKLDEQMLIHLCKKGSSSAQRLLYDRLSPKMFPVCIRYMGNREDAADVLQEGFVTLFSKIESYTGSGSFEGWARKIFANTALMSLRKRDVLRESEEIDTAWSLSNDAPSAVQNLDYQELLKLISSLPDGFRTVFNLYVLEGFSHKEIAQMLGISEGTSRSQLQRARQILQKKIEEREK